MRYLNQVTPGAHFSGLRWMQLRTQRPTRGSQLLLQIRHTGHSRTEHPSAWQDVIPSPGGHDTSLKPLYEAVCLGRGPPWADLVRILLENAKSAKHQLAGFSVALPQANHAAEDCHFLTSAKGQGLQQKIYQASGSEPLPCKCECSALQDLLSPAPIWSSHLSSPHLLLGEPLWAGVQLGSWSLEPRLQAALVRRMGRMHPSSRLLNPGTPESPTSALPRETSWGLAG